MLDKEFQYYKDHQKELVRLYDGKFLVIVDEEVKSVHDSGLDAYVSAEATYPPGTFLIQECSAGEESYTQTYHSPRVIF